MVANEQIIFANKAEKFCIGNFLAHQHASIYDIKLVTLVCITYAAGTWAGAWVGAIISSQPSEPCRTLVTLLAMAILSATVGCLRRLPKNQVDTLLKLLVLCTFWLALVFIA